MTAFFEDLLGAPDRDACPGAGRCVSVHGDEDETELQQLESQASAIVALRRRGIDHGQLAEFDPPEREPAALPLERQLEERWQTAKPIVVHDLVAALEPEDEALRAAWFAQLGDPRGLERFLDERSSELPREFLVGGPTARLEDKQRDLAKIAIEASPRRDEPAPRSGPPWAKVARLSTHAADASLRLRLGFGAEGPDDASADPARLRQVRRLAQVLLPGSQAIHEHEQLAGLLSPWLGAAPLFSQHIAYWNAPEGGALFHHDAFAESDRDGQRGVLYVQRSGWTAWLALSIDDLARRVMEFMEVLAEDDMGELRRGLFPADEDFAQAQRWCAPGRFARLRRELGRPGQGLLGPLVNRGPEFTGLLADAGHAFLLGPGDGILLPNHGLPATCMHSVFCAGPEVAFGLSMGIFSSSPAAAQEGQSGGEGERDRGSARRRQPRTGESRGAGPRRRSRSRRRGR